MIQKCPKMDCQEPVEITGILHEGDNSPVYLGAPGGRPTVRVKHGAHVFDIDPYEASGFVNGEYRTALQSKLEALHS